MRTWFSLLRNTLSLEWIYWSNYWLWQGDEIADDMRTGANAGWLKLFQWVRS